MAEVIIFTILSIIFNIISIIFTIIIKYLFTFIDTFLLFQPLSALRQGCYPLLQMTTSN